MSPKASSKKAKLKPSTETATAAKFSLPEGPGLPALDSVVEVFKLPAPTGLAAKAGLPKKTYTIIRTTEVDGYEPIANSQGDISAALALAAAPTGNKFKGTDRKAAKLSIAKKQIEPFSDVRTLIKSLADEEDMANHDPEITRDASMNRVDEEKRNIRVAAFLYAASREADNDFHLIIGRDPKKSPEMYMTMELSGLPTANSDSFKKLKAARDAYKTFFGDNLPGTSYDFYHPPIPVNVEGSLFFDVTHATGQRPGPKSLKSRMPVIWEVHPITKIELEP